MADQVFDLVDRLGATDEQLDFPIVHALATNGYASLEHDEFQDDLTSLFEAIAGNSDARSGFKRRCINTGKLKWF